MAVKLMLCKMQTLHHGEETASMERNPDASTFVNWVLSLRTSFFLMVFWHTTHATFNRTFLEKYGCLEDA